MFEILLITEWWQWEAVTGFFVNDVYKLNCSIVPLLPVHESVFRVASIASLKNDNWKKKTTCKKEVLTMQNAAFLALSC